LKAKRTLSRREEEVLALIIQEHTSAEIAEKLHVSIRTVETHRKNILRKTKSGSLIGLVKFSIRHGLLDGYFFKKD
jgi:DNA-binding CsgD family transcriptional regulator